MAKKERKSKKYVGIGKVGYIAGKGNICVKYRFNDINNFLAFMNRKYTPYWINIFSNDGPDKNRLVFTWGRKKGLEIPK